MRVLPILFNTEMVKAILDGRKTVTRRVIKFPDGQTGRLPECGARDYLYYPGGIKRPPYQTGDILYVRETVWQKIGYYLDVDGETKGSYYNEFLYVATDEKPETGWNYSWVKRPSIHMPQEAARIFLKVTDVRVERLQEITEEEAYSEGTDPWDDACYLHNGWHPTLADPDSGGPCDIVSGFQKLWNSTIKKSDLDRYGWDASPWVWVIEFERSEKPDE